MSSKTIEPAVSSTSLSTPWVGTVLTVASGLSFLFVCMFLPLVGKAGAAVPYARQNFFAFLAILLISIAFAGLATFSKIARRKIDGSPLPKFSIILLGLGALLLVALLTGLLHI